MNILSSATPQSKFTLLPSSQNLSPLSKFHFTFPPKPHHSQLPPCSSKQQSSSSSTILEQGSPILSESEETESSEDVLMVRRPTMEFPSEQDNGDVEEYGSKTLDAALSKFAKKLPIFEPDAVGSGTEKAPLKVNLDLALYKAKVLARNFKYDEARQILEKCIYYWPEDGRAYVALGKVFSKQSRIEDAKAVYEKGCQATQGENPYIWQCWAVLESKMGNVRRARELFDAATVADKKHIAGWHGWAVLELKQGNIKKARQLLAKGLRYCNGNEYVYQTLALLEVKSNRYEQARYLFKQATKCNPKSCASWLAWAQMEIQQGNNSSARLLFEKAVQSSPKNRFAWHIWGVFELNQGNTEKSRKLLKIGHAVNPRDPVLLQSLGLLEYKHSSANFARTLFRKASELDPKHQPVWIAWGWMEWKEGNLASARRLYQKALAIDTTTESAARCLQAWGVLEQRVGNLSAARRLFRSSLTINNQSYVTWMTLASFEEEQGNTARAEEIRDLYFQQRTEVVDDASWIMGFFDIIDPALDRIKRLLNLEKNSSNSSENSNDDELLSMEDMISVAAVPTEEERDSGFDLDAFIKERLSLDPKQLDDLLNSPRAYVPTVSSSPRKVWRLANPTSKKAPQSTTSEG